MVVQTPEELKRRVLRYRDTAQEAFEGFGPTQQAEAPPPGSPPPAEPPEVVGFPTQQTTRIDEIASEMMQKDSPMMRRAEAAGRAFGQERGMLNSSITAEASQNAVLDRVLPMAETESTQRFTRQQAARDFGYRLIEREQEFAHSDTLFDKQTLHDVRMAQINFENAQDLSEQEFEQELGMSREAFAQQQVLMQRELENQLELADADTINQMRLSSQQFGFAQQLSEQDAAQRLTALRAEYAERGLLSEQEFVQNIALSEQDFQQKFKMSKEQYLQEKKLQAQRIGAEKDLAMMDADARKDLLEMEKDMRVELAQMELEADDKGEVNAFVTSAQQMYQEGVRSILSNKDLSADERKSLIRAEKKNLAARMQLANRMFKIRPPIKWRKVVDKAEKDWSKGKNKGGRGGGGGGKVVGEIRVKNGVRQEWDGKRWVKSSGGR